MDIANQAARKAGLLFHFVHDTRRAGNYWIVTIVAVAGTYIVKIKADTGDVIEFSHK